MTNLMDVSTLVAGYGSDDYEHIKEEDDEDDEGDGKRDKGKSGVSMDFNHLYR